MSNTYDDQNVFAKILRGELPAVKLFEDEDTFVFMDIMPRGPGHCLVIPKTPFRNLLDANPKSLAAVAITAQRMAKAVMTAFNAEGVTIQQFNETAGGQLVFHYHVHVIPRHDGVKLNPPGIMGDMDEIAALGEKIKTALAQ